MLILERLVRAHYELANGEGPVPFSAMLTSYAKAKDLSQSDAYFSLLGYKHDDQLSATDRHKYRKMFFNGKLKELRKVLKANSDVSLLKTLKALDCVTDPVVHTIAKHNLGELESLARVLATYLQNNNETVLASTKGNIVFSDYIQSYLHRLDRPALNKFLKDARFKQLLEIGLPTWVFEETTEPIVSQGKIFSPTKLTTNQCKDVINWAVNHCFMRSLDVPEKVYFFMVKYATTYQQLPAESYLKFLDYAHSLQTTVKGLFELCGMAHVDNLDIYQEVGNVLYLDYDGHLRVLSESSVKDTDYVILSRAQVKSLFEMGSLRTLTWDTQGASISHNGNRVYLKTIYPEKTTNDFTGGIG